MKTLDLEKLARALFLAAAASGCGGMVGDLEPQDAQGAADELASVELALSGSVAIGSTLQTTAPLNLRSGPGTNYRVLHVIPLGAKVTVVKAAPTNSFYNLRHAGVVGWSHGGYLKLVSTPTAPAPSGPIRFRFPISLSDTQCGAGRCAPSAYYDTHRTSGYRRDWSCKTGSTSKTYDQHSGSDFAIGGFAAMDQGRTVLAAAPGKVIAAHDGEYDRCTTGKCGTANYVMIRHADGTVSQYWHLKKWSVRVKVGDYVSCGAVLGKVGSSGLSTGPHLHFGVIPAGSSNPVDPFLHAGACGGSSRTWWTAQGSWGRLPGGTCQ